MILNQNSLLTAVPKIRTAYPCQLRGREHLLIHQNLRDFTLFPETQVIFLLGFFCFLSAQKNSVFLPSETIRSILDFHLSQIILFCILIVFWQGKGCPPNYLAFNSLILPTLFFFSFSFESYLFCTQRTLRERIASPFTIDYLSRILFDQIEICFNSTTWHIFSLLHGSFQKFTDILPSLIYC